MQASGVAQHAEVPAPGPASPNASGVETLTVEKDENETIDWGGSQQQANSPQDPSDEEEREETTEPRNNADIQAGGGCFYNEDDKPYSIRLLFTPDKNDDDASQLLPSSGWWAEMFVRCDSVPQLMREGLRWSSENIWREEGHFSFGPIPYPWGPIARQYYLRDVEHSPPRWTANMQVHAEKVTPLSRFRPGQQQQQ
ncbi:hypothetical protein PG988_001516 [Apiospora saccharicola]